MDPRIGINIGSTRPGRDGPHVARWVHDGASRRRDATFEIVDIASFGLPLLDEPVPAALSSDYVHDHTRRWSETVAGLDGFVFVTPEHNHSVPASLKNAIDFLFVEWNDKAAGFVGYGIQGGTRAVEHLRQILAEVRVADVRTAVALSLFHDFEDMRDLRPAPHHEQTLGRMLDELIAMAGATASLRSSAARQGDAA
jgi:NAD(P)H-dependent FMN reductase